MIALEIPFDLCKIADLLKLFNAYSLPLSGPDNFSTNFTTPNPPIPRSSFEFEKWE
jgi:hypothetical protein